jgi:hypothetical protein
VYTGYLIGVAERPDCHRGHRGVLDAVLCPGRLLLGESVTDVRDIEVKKVVLLIALIVATVFLLGHDIWQRRRPSKPTAPTSPAGGHQAAHNDDRWALDHR